MTFFTSIFWEMRQQQQAWICRPPWTNSKTEVVSQNFTFNCLNSSFMREKKNKVGIAKYICNTGVISNLIPGQSVGEGFSSQPSPGLLHLGNWNEDKMPDICISYLAIFEFLILLYLSFKILHICVLYFIICLYFIFCYICILYFAIFVFCILLE